MIGCTSEKWFTDRVRSGLFPFRRIGRGIRFTDDDVSGIIDACASMPRLKTAIGGGETLDPHGFYVYMLFDAAGIPIYVGQSQNIFTRLGTHMGPRNHRDVVKKVQLVRCADRPAMIRMESALLHEHKPSLNINGVGR